MHVFTASAGNIKRIPDEAGNSNSTGAASSAVTGYKEIGNATIAGDAGGAAATSCDRDRSRAGSAEPAAAVEKTASGGGKRVTAEAGKGHRSSNHATEDAIESATRPAADCSAGKGSAGKGSAGKGSAGKGSAGKGSAGSSGYMGNRRRVGYMQYIHGFIGCVLVLLALIHIPFPEPLAWLPYSVAAVLAFITLKSELSIPISRVLAIATAGMMFFFFAVFFLVVPKLEASWYTTQYGWAAVCLILSAFVMIPILSEYSCRLKADCMEARQARRNAFFSVPDNVRPESR